VILSVAAASHSAPPTSTLHITLWFPVSSSLTHNRSTCYKRPSLQHSRHHHDTLDSWCPLPFSTIPIKFYHDLIRTFVPKIYTEEHLTIPLRCPTSNRTHMPMEAEWSRIATDMLLFLHHTGPTTIIRIITHTFTDNLQSIPCQILAARVRKH
jgi:hypothetical protein